MNTIPGSSYIEKLIAGKVDFISNLVENYRKLHNPNCIIFFPVVECYHGSLKQESS